MYQKYYTEALVLKSYERGEEDRVYALYTREFGLVIARAKAVRSERSRMRYALQSYSRVNLALVRGKNGWRVAGAAAHTAGVAKGIPTFVRISELLLRLVTGEERNEYLFGAVSEAHEALMKEDSHIHPTVEIICVARILYALGYLSGEALETTLFAHTAYAGEYLKQVERVRGELLSRINRAITEAQL